MARAYRLIKGVRHVKEVAAWVAYLDLTEVRTSPSKPELEVCRKRIWDCSHDHFQLTDADRCATEAQESRVWAR